MILLPMAKASLQIMKACNAFIKEKGFAKLKQGWFMMGASKRGWTAWLVGATTCKDCVTIAGIMPLVPIVPSLQAELHRQWQAYQGFSFAFDPYMKVGLIARLDEEYTTYGMGAVDPLTFGDRLSEIPKLAVLSSDDEFMMMDWSNIWYDQLNKDGESHLLIAPNAEHTLGTNLPDVLGTVSTFVKSIASGKEKRPGFDYTFDNKTGEIAVTLRHKIKPKKVVLRHSETMQSDRRDFRWMREENERTPACKWPFINLKPFHVDILGATCVQLTWWHEKTLKPDKDGVYRGLPPKAHKDGHWVGYYVEMIYEGDTSETSWLFDNKFKFTTPGFTWPNTLPFEPCNSLEGTCLEQSV